MELVIKVMLAPAVHCHTAEVPCRQSISAVEEVDFRKGWIVKSVDY